jgi:hypothetical protein
MLLLPTQLLRCCCCALLLHIYMQHLHNTAVNHIPKCQVLGIILPNIFTLLPLLLLCCINARHVQQQLLLVRRQFEQPATQQLQRCYGYRLGQLLLAAAAAVLQCELACGGAEAAALLRGLGGSSSTATTCAADRGSRSGCSSVNFAEC